MPSTTIADPPDLGGLLGARAPAARPAAAPPQKADEFPSPDHVPILSRPAGSIAAKLA